MDVIHLLDLLPIQVPIPVYQTHLYPTYALITVLRAQYQSFQRFENGAFMSICPLFPLSSTCRFLSYLHLVLLIDSRRAIVAYRFLFTR